MLKKVTEFVKGVVSEHTLQLYLATLYAGSTIGVASAAPKVMGDAKPPASDSAPPEGDNS